jgi:steroid delta-isomerase-like uncharacterized protein
MSVDPNSAEARVKLVDEHAQAEVERDLEKIMRTWGESPDFDDVPWAEKFKGRDGIREHYDELLTAFPDLDIIVHDRHVTDSMVILEVTVTGTHLGDWRDLPAMGRRMESRVCALYGFDEKGLLNLERTYYDKAKILEQLGIFQDPGTTTGKVMAAITGPSRSCARFFAARSGATRRPRERRTRERTRCVRPCGRAWRAHARPGAECRAGCAARRSPARSGP